MIIKNLLAPNKKPIWFAVFWTLFIIFSCLKTSSGEKMIYSFPNADKIVHFTFYFVFVFFWYRYLFFIKRTQFIDKIILVIVSIVFGIGIELCQKYLTTTRQADIWDVIANSTGSITGLFVAVKLYKIIIIDSDK